MAFLGGSGEIDDAAVQENIRKFNIEQWGRDSCFAMSDDEFWPKFLQEFPSRIDDVPE